MYRYIQRVLRCGQRYIKKYIKNSDVLMYQRPIHHAIRYIKSLSKTGGYAPSARLYSADLRLVMPYPRSIAFPMACVCIQTLITAGMGAFSYVQGPIHQLYQYIKKA